MAAVKNASLDAKLGHLLSELRELAGDLSASVTETEAASLAQAERTLEQIRERRIASALDAETAKELKARIHEGGPGQPVTLEQFMDDADISRSDFKSD